MKNLDKNIRRSIALEEKSRLEQVKGYKVIRKKSSRVFDELAIYTASLFNTQIAIINFVDQHNLWQKKGQPLKQMKLPHAETDVCSLAISKENPNTFQTLAVAPALVTNPIIMSELGMAFYAAVPIVTAEGTQIGMVCILDKNRREFPAQEKRKLEWVAGMVQKEMEKKTARKLCI